MFSFVSRKFFYETFLSKPDRYVSTFYRLYDPGLVSAKYMSVYVLETA